MDHDDTAAHKVLMCPELLDVILSHYQYGSLRCLYHAAQVCRLWSPIALDLLYEEFSCRDSSGLFEKLAPMINIEADGSDWDDVDSTPSAEPPTASAYLEEVTISPSFFTTPVVAALSDSRRLRELYTHRLNEAGKQDLAALVARLPQIDTALHPTAFLTLRKLSLLQPLRQVLSFLDFRASTEPLVYLLVEAPHDETASSVHRFLTVVQSRLRALREFIIFLPARPFIFTRDAPQTSRAEFIITFETLRPLSGLFTLTKIVIWGGQCVRMSPQELEELVSKLPLLEMFELCPNPSHAGSSLLTLESLIPIARHCPRLQSLSLFLDATPRCPLLDADDAIGPAPVGQLPPFQSLKTFSPGLSLLTPDTMDRAIDYLCLLLPSSCYILAILPSEDVEWESLRPQIGDDALEEMQTVVQSIADMWDGVSDGFAKRTSERRGAS